MSRRASRPGRRSGATRPRCSFDERRPDRIPPRAPALDRKAGTSTEQGGYWLDVADAARLSTSLSRITFMVEGKLPGESSPKSEGGDVGIGTARAAGQGTSDWGAGLSPGNPVG